ncbi:MAG: hypothetical protein MR295_02010 [Ruminococcus bromii]|nr:hypothetical protein [Ruminococcus bromii]
MSKNAGRESLPYSVFQNFLTSRRLIERLIKIAQLTKEDTVLEIGAGKGHITKALADTCKTVLAYEIDRRLYESLKPQLPGNVRLYGVDFLKCALPKSPSPRVDTVLLELKRKAVPDIQLSERRDFAAFLTHSFRYGLFGSHALLTKKQISTALRLSGLPPVERSGDILYVQWLCLFRCWRQFGKKIGG